MPHARRGTREIAYTSFDPSGRGARGVVVLAPGIGSGSRLFGTLPRRFVRAGFRCVTFEPLGIPPSGPLPGDVAPPEEQARDLLAVIDAAAPGGAHVVGVSLGGGLGLVAAALSPGSVHSVVAMGTAAARTARGARVHRFFEIVASSVPEADRVHALAPFLFGATFHERHPNVVADLLRAARLDEPRRRLLLAQARGLSDFDVAPYARAVRCPVLCVAGAEDALAPPLAVRRTAELVPGARYVELPEAGHALLLESRAAFAAALAFLQDPASEDIQGISP